MIPMQSDPKHQDLNIDEITRLKRNFCSGCFHYCHNDGNHPTSEEVQAAQDALEHIKAGKISDAAIAAGRTSVSLGIFEAALKSI